MNVSGFATDPREWWTTPYPTGWFGVKLRLLKGSVLYPHIGGALRDKDAVTMRAGRETEMPNWFNCIPMLTTGTQPIQRFSR